MLTRPKAFGLERQEGKTAEIETLSPSLNAESQKIKILERIEVQSEGPSLEDATVIVAGGRGLGKAENFQLVEDLATALGGAAGATRAIVDAGWLPYSYQIGQTGKTVKPNSVYCLWHQWRYPAPFGYERLQIYCSHQQRRKCANLLGC